MKSKNRASRRSRKVTLPVLIERDENGIYVGTVPTLRSCYTQGETLEDLYKNLREAVALSIEVEDELFKEKVPSNSIIGFQNMEFAR